MRVQFVNKEKGPDHLICEAEILFGPESGALFGMKLMGFSLWQGAEGEVYVTFPSRPYGVGGERRYWDYLRSVEANPSDARKLKEWILEQYRTTRAA